MSEVQGQLCRTAWCGCWSHAIRIRVSITQLFTGLQPIEYLWRKTKKKTTHNEYFAQFEELSTAVEAKLAYFAAHPGEVQGLFGRYCQETNLVPQELALAA